jgi:hypothetical protein
MSSRRKHVKHVNEQEEREAEASVMLEGNSDEELEDDAASNPFPKGTETRLPSRTTKEFRIYRVLGYGFVSGR